MLISPHHTKPPKVGVSMGSTTPYTPTNNEKEVEIVWYHLENEYIAAVLPHYSSSILEEK